MKTQRLVAWITFLAIFAMAARISIDPDTWWHLRAGQWILENRTILKQDFFSYTRYGVDWRYPGWLVEVPMYMVYSVFGFGGLNLWTAFLVSLAFVFLWKALSGGTFVKAFGLILAASAAGVYWAARPYLVTFLLAAIYLWILEAFRWCSDSGGCRRIWWLAPLMTIWANSHGGFAVGFILWGIYVIADLRPLATSLLVRLGLGLPDDPDVRSAWLDRTKRLVSVGALMILAVSLNPSGPAMLLYPFQTLGIGALQDYIQEWQSPDFHSISVQPFVWMIFLTLAAAGISRLRLTLSDFLLVAVFGTMGLLAGRNVALFALAAAPVLVRHASNILSDITPGLGWRGVDDIPASCRQSMFNGLLLVAIVAAVCVKAVSVFPNDVNWDALRSSLPVKAVEYLQREQPPGRLFNSYNWGGYLIWALRDYPVFIDGRTDLYDDELVGQWLKVMRVEPGWQGILRAYQVHLVLVEDDTFLTRTLAGEQDWVMLYEDEVAAIFQYRSP